jgi:hypothetical protein
MHAVQVDRQRLDRAPEGGAPLQPLGRKRLEAPLAARAYAPMQANPRHTRLDRG